MRLPGKKAIILGGVLILTTPLYAQDEPEQNKEVYALLLEKNHSPELSLTEAPAQSSEEENVAYSFLDFISSEAYAATIDKDKEEERKILRGQWKDMLNGVDIFYPYFKAEEIEDWVSEKTSIHFFKFKGKPKFVDAQIIYVFKLKL